jgi:hypothetical protein
MPPIVDGKELTPDEAIAKNRCPECGVDLTKVNPIAELNSHWQSQQRDSRQNPEALRRQQLLKDYIKQNNVRTSDMPEPTAKPAEPAV